MIPVRLVLRNFLSYVQPEPIDFTRFHVACVSGENGVGKSALLLDAITWALFGAARGCEGGQNQDRLIRDGADEAHVELTFELNETTYQIVRRRNRTGKGEARFMVLTPDGPTNLGGESIRETDQRIAATLRMDYRTFVASAFFLQGRADDFLARMRPEDRKEVFARLLDLGTYERLEAAARDRAREAERHRADRALLAERLAAGAEDPEALEEQLAEAARSAAEAQKGLERAQRIAKDAAGREAELRKQEALCEQERRGLDDAERRLETERAAVEAREAELADLDTLLARSEEVNRAAEEIKRLRTQEERVRQAQTKAALLREKASVLSERIRAEGDAITKRRREQKRAAAKLTAEIVTLEKSESRLKELDGVLEAGRDLEPALARTNQQLDAQRRAQAHAGEEVAGVRARLEEVREKLNLLAGEQGLCPLCGEHLDATHRRAITGELRARRRELTEQARSHESAVEVARKEMKRLSEEVHGLGEAQRELGRVETTRSALVVKVERLSDARGELARLEEDAAADERSLATASFAAEARKQLAALQVQIERVYDPATHERILARVSELAGLEELHARIREAGGLRYAVARDLEGARGRAEEAARQVAAHRKQIAALTRALEHLPEARDELEQLEAAAAEAAALAAQGIRLATQLEERLAATRRGAEQAATARREENESALVRRRYDLLTTAFGRGGIPDRIIENALPDLRDDANDILGRLSDYEMSLQFAMSRETKSGKTRETFDVLVHHDGGIRDYQMFSGGEAFRIAFAVRLALSKLLVRRAGARLETLVVDEGFATQDPGGRERLVDAINLARTEFAKVLVITHLEELKGMFDTQIRVTKGDVEGSKIEIVI